MKNFLLAATILIFGTSFSFAASSTDMNTKWVCTTNASSSDVSTDKAADAQAAKTASSATDSFAFAAKHCRDCTKITCEASN